MDLISYKGKLLNKQRVHLVCIIPSWYNEVTFVFQSILNTRIIVYFFPFAFCGPLGGVTGLPEFKPPYWYFAFFSDGLRI